MQRAARWLLAPPLRNLTLGVIYMLTVTAFATAAYVAAGWSFGDALYMVIITVYTVGYDEPVRVATPMLRGITVSLIIFGCTGMIYLTGALVQFITLDRLNTILGLSRMNTQIERLRDHVIICGFGRLGAMLAQELTAGGISLVVLEQSEAQVARARGLGYLCVHTDATAEEALQAAGIMHARTLATVLSNDAANVFITLSARSLNPALEIIARGELPSTESKLLQAGANKVVLPAHIGAERIAEMILYRRSSALTRDSAENSAFESNLVSMGLDLDTMVAAPGSAVVGRAIEQIEQNTRGILIVQVNRRSGESITRPDRQLVIEAGDGVTFLGRGGSVETVRSLFEHRAEENVRLTGR